MKRLWWKLIMRLSHAVFGIGYWLDSYGARLNMQMLGWGAWTTSSEHGILWECALCGQPTKTTWWVADETGHRFALVCEKCKDKYIAKEAK